MRRDCVTIVITKTSTDVDHENPTLVQRRIHEHLVRRDDLPDVGYRAAVELIAS